MQTKIAINLTPILTKVRDIEQVARAYASGTLANHMERVH